MIDEAGKVGIGTTEPSVKLELKDNADILIKNTNIAGSSSFSTSLRGLRMTTHTMLENYYGNAIWLGSTDADFTTTNPKYLAGIVSRSTENYVGDSDSGMALDFATTPNDAGTAPTPSIRMTINQDGNVGIGTTSPLAKLDVGGDIFFDKLAALPTDKDSHVGLIRTQGGGSFPFNNAGSLIYRTRVTSDAGRSSHLFYTGSPSTEKMRINETGNVGIGAVAPDKKLEINSATGDCLRLTYNDNDGSASYYSDSTVSSSGDLTIAASGGDISFDDENLSTTGTLGCGAITSSGSIKTNTNNYVLEGYTTGRNVFRMMTLNILNGTDASSLKCSTTSSFNGDSIAETDNIVKNATTGDFTLNSAGTVLTIEKAGLAGDVVGAKGWIRSINTGTYYPIAVAVSGDDIILVIYNLSGTAQDFTTLVDDGSIYVDIIYFTNA